MRILFLSHTPAGGDFVVGSHHLAHQFAKKGMEVVHLSPPVTPAHLLLWRKRFERTRLKRWLKGGTEIKGFADVIPGSLLPWGVAARMSSNPHVIFGEFIKRSVVSILEKYRFRDPDLVIVDEPRLCALLELFPKSRVVYRPTDLYSMIRSDQSIIAAERYMLKKANRFIATSAPVAEHLKTLGASEVLVVENGVDLDVFLRTERQALPEHSSERPIAVYAGALDKRFGVHAIATAAQSCPEVDFLLAGPKDERVVEGLRKFKNVVLLGAIEFESLPDLFSRASLALLPLSDDPSNRGRSPMKIFEYGAAGLPVVATRTEELSNRKLGFVALADDSHQFSDFVREIALGRLTLSDGRDIAVRNGWEEKANRILEYSMD